MAEEKPCKICKKSSLSLLLLRPVPITKEAGLQPDGSHVLNSDAKLVEGLLPKRLPTESRFVLRLLREGYVYIYVEDPPAGFKKQWLIYRIAFNGDVIPEESPSFSAAPYEACSRSDHNPQGAILVEIPQAHFLIGKELNIAFSANLWNDTIKTRSVEKLKAEKKSAKEKAKEGEYKLWQTFVLGEENQPNTFKPSVENLGQYVLECAIPRYNFQKMQASEDMFVTQIWPTGERQTKQLKEAAKRGKPMAALELECLAKQMADAASRHPQTKGKELAIVLADPAGIVAELNNLRLLRQRLEQAEIEKPENLHPLKSIAAIDGLKQIVVNKKEFAGFETVCPLRTKAAFDRQRWPQGTEWLPLSEEEKAEYKKRAAQAGIVDVVNQEIQVPKGLTIRWPLGGGNQPEVSKKEWGRVVYPDAEKRIANWARDAIKRSWSVYTPFYDDEKRRKWLSEFEKMMKDRHGNVLERYEMDWITAREAPEFAAHFASHFHSKDPNDPKKVVSSGEIYASENKRCTLPIPCTKGEVLKRYIKLFEFDINDEQAIALRAIVGNQQSVIELISQQLAGDPGGEGMRDKTYDFLKGVLGEYKDTQFVKKYSWISDVLAGFSFGTVTAGMGALMDMAVHHPQLVAEGQAGMNRFNALMNKLNFMAGIQHGIEYSVGALKGLPLKTPLLISMRIPVDEALDVERARGKATGTSRTRLKRKRKENRLMIKAWLLTTVEDFKTANGDLHKVLLDPNSGQVSMNTKIVTIAGASITMTEEMFLRLSAETSALSAKGIDAVRSVVDSVRSVGKGSGTQIQAVTLKAEGRLAIGSILIQALGWYNGMKQMEKAGTLEELNDAWYGVFDSMAGALGGVMELWYVAAEASTLARLGEEAVGKSWFLGSLRVVGGIAGAAGGLINAISLIGKGKNASQKSYVTASKTYYVAAAAFTGTAVTSGLGAAGAIADVAVKRGVGGALAEGVAARLGARGALFTAEALGLGISATVSGVGIVLLGVGIMAQLFAMLATPSELQAWMSRSYFGQLPDKTQPPNKFAKGDWKTENDVLMATLKKENV